MAQVGFDPGEGGGAKQPTTQTTTQDWRQLLSIFRQQAAQQPAQLQSIQPQQFVPWGEMYKTWQRGQEWAVTPDEAETPITKREYDRLVDERIKRTPQEVLADLRRTADNFVRWGYVQDPEQFIRMEVGDWVGQDVGLSRELAHTASERTTPGVREGLAPIMQQQPVDTAPIKATWLPMIWKQAQAAADGPTPYPGVPRYEAPEQVTGALGYLEEARKRATAHYEAPTVPEQPKLTTEQRQALAERGIYPAVYTAGFGKVPGLSPAEIWQAAKAIPAAGVIPRTAEELARGVVTGMAQPAYLAERGVGYTVLESMKQPGYAGRRVSALPVYVQAAYKQRGITPEQELERYQTITAKLREADLTPREQLDLARIGYTWMGEPDSLGNALDDMKQGASIDTVAQKYQSPIHEMIGQIILDPLNLLGSALGKRRDAKLLDNVRAQYVDAAAPLVDEAVDSIPWFKRAFQGAAGKIDDINPFKLTAQSKARALDRDINSFVGMVVSKADTPDDAKNLVRTFINNPDKLTAEFGSFVRSPAAEDVRTALRTMDFDKFKSLKIETPEKAAQMVMAGMEAPATEFKVMDFMSELYDKSIAATNKLYDVKKPMTAERWANGFKGYMADFYMGISPRALIRNAAGNVTFLSYDGLLSFASHSQIDDYMMRSFGFSPMQAQRGLGLTREYSGPQRGIPIVHDLAEKGRIIYTGQTPIIGEGWARYGGTYAAMQKFDHRYWRPGPGGLIDFSIFDDIFPQLDPSTKTNFMAAVRQSLNADELIANTDKALDGGRMVAKYLDDAEEVSPGFINALQEALDDATDAATGTVNKDRLTTSVQDIQAEIEKRVVRAAEVDGITPKPVILPEGPPPAVAAAPTPPATQKMAKRVSKLTEKGAQQRLDRLQGFIGEAEAGERTVAENVLKDWKAEVPLLEQRVAGQAVPTVKPKEAALLPGIEYAEELRAGRPPEIAERMYSNMVREQAAWGASSEGFVLDAQEMGRAAYELEMWEKGKWAESAWAKYVSKDIPFPAKMNDVRRLMETNPDLVLNWQDYLIRQMATRNTPSWQLLQNHPAVKDIVRMLPLDEVQAIAEVRPSVKLELEELIGVLPEIRDPVLPRDIGELAVHAGIDPTTAGYEEWEKVLGYAQERYRYHELRMLPEGLDSIAALEAKRLRTEGWAFGEWRQIRGGRMSAAQEKVFRKNLIPVDMNPKQFYQANGDAAQAYFDLAEELETMLAGIPRPVDTAAGMTAREMITLSAGEMPTLPLKEGAYPAYPRPEVWKIDVGRITPERLPTVPERGVPLLPEGAPPRAVQIRDEIRGAHSGQIDGVLVANDPVTGEYIGHLDYAHLQASGEPVLIQWVEVPEARQRQGIASQLVDRLRQENPDRTVDWGMTTPEGTALREAIEGVPEAALPGVETVTPPPPVAAAAELPDNIAEAYRIIRENEATAGAIGSGRIAPPRARAARVALGDMAAGRPSKNVQALELALGPEDYQRLFGEVAEAAPAAGVVPGIEESKAVQWVLDKAKKTTLEDGTVERWFEGKIPKRQWNEIRDTLEEAGAVRKDVGKSSLKWNVRVGETSYVATVNARTGSVKFLMTDESVPAAAAVAGKVPGELRALSNTDLEAEIARLRAADDPGLKDALVELRRRTTARERDRFTAQRRAAGELPGMPRLEMGAPGVAQMEAPEAAARGEVLLGRGTERMRKAQADEIAARAPTLFDMPAEEVVTPAMKRTRIADLQDEISAITAEMKKKPAAMSGYYETQIARRQAEVDRLLGEALPRVAAPSVEQTLLAIENQLEPYGGIVIPKAKRRDAGRLRDAIRDGDEATIREIWDKYFTSGTRGRAVTGGPKEVKTANAVDAALERSARAAIGDLERAAVPDLAPAQERARAAAEAAMRRAETAVPRAAVVSLDDIPYTQGIDPTDLKKSEAGWRLRGRSPDGYVVEKFNPESWQWIEVGRPVKYAEAWDDYSKASKLAPLTEADLQRGLEKLRQSGMMAYSDGVESAAQAETNVLKRLLDEETGALRLPGKERPAPVKYAPVSDDLKATIRQRVQQSLVPARNDANMAKLQWAYEVVNRALYDYDKRYEIDRLLSIIFPFHFWPTRTGYQSAVRTVTKPWTVTAYYRMRKAIEKINEDMNFPRRYGPTAMKVPVPEGAVPEWAEKNVMVDLAPYIFPHTGVWPFNYLSKVNWDDNGEAKTALDRVADLEAMFSMSPHWPISMAMDIARGKKEDIGYVLPQTGVLKGITAALKEKHPDRFGWVPPGGVNLEKPFRTGMGLPEAQGYEETYWPESMVVDMAANGEITPEQRDAILNPADPQYHQGDIWDEAVNRAAIFKQLPGAVSYMTGIRSGLVPSGEMKLRAGAAEVGEIYEREQAGEKGPEIRAERSQWYKDNPWYTGRGLLWTPGPEREMDFRESEYYDLRNAIYDRYNTQLDEVALGDWRARQTVYDARQKELDSLDAEYPDVNITPSFWGYTASEMVEYREGETLKPLADDYYALQPEGFADAEGNIDWDAFYQAREDYTDNLAAIARKKGLLDTGLYADFAVGGKPDKTAISSWLTRSRFEQYLRRNDDPKDALWSVYKDTVITPAQGRMYDAVEKLEEGGDRQKIFDWYYNFYPTRPAADFITRVLATYPEKGWTYGELEQAYTDITLPGLEEYARLGQTPREAAISDLWDFYMTLPSLDKKKFRQDLGERFDNNFVNKETRDYDAITDEELINWLNYAGLNAGSLPETAEAQGVASRVAEAQQMAERAAAPPVPTAPTERFVPTPQFTPSDPTISGEYQQAIDEREEMYSEVETKWPKFSEWSDLYSKLETWQTNEREAMQAALQPAWDFMEEWQKAHPTMVKWFYSDEWKKSYPTLAESLSTPSADPRGDAVSDLWNFYMALSALDKRRLKEELGDRFLTYFVDKDSRNYDKISTDELMAWLGYVGLDSGLGAKVAEERAAAADAWVAAGKPAEQAKPEVVTPTPTPTKASTLTAAAGQSAVVSAVAGLFSPSAPTTSAEYDQALAERGQMWDVVDAAWPNYSAQMDAYNALKWWQFDEREALQAQLEPVWDFMDSWKASHPTMVKWLYPTWQPYVPKEKAAAAPKAAARGKAPTKQQILKGTANDWEKFAKTIKSKQLLELIQGYLLLSPLQRDAYLARFPQLAAWLQGKDAKWLGKLAESLAAYLALTEPKKQRVSRPPTLRWYQSYA